MKKIWLFLLLFIPSITFAQEKDFVEHYIKSRFEIGTNIAELEQRWGPNGEIDKMSSESVYTEFWERYAKGLIRVVKEEGLTRKIEILMLRQDPRADDQKVWIAKVSLVDKYASNQTPQRTDTIITLLIKNVPNSKKFQVIGWGQAYLNDREQAKSNSDINESDNPPAFEGEIASQNTFLKEYVIKNPDIRHRLEECPKHTTYKPCVMYVRNTSSKEQIAEDFFDEAAHKSGRVPYIIRIENQKYAKTIIPKGSVAEIKIPPLR